jgi:hypothetical protein
MQSLSTVKDPDLLEIYNRLQQLIDDNNYPGGKYISLEVSNDCLIDTTLKLTFFCQQYLIHITQSPEYSDLYNFEMIYYPPKVFLQKLQGRVLTFAEELKECSIVFEENLPRDEIIDSIFGFLTLNTYDEYLHAVHEAIWQIHNIK